MRKKRTEPQYLSVFANNGTFQTCIKQPVARKLNLKSGSILAVEICEEDQKIEIKKGMALIYVHEPTSILK